MSGLFHFTEPTMIGPYHIKSDIICQINIFALHHNPRQWQKPEEFLPDRFDPENELSKTPTGEKRHPMSFGPFLGGKRICIGKTFAMQIAKIISAILIWNYELEFENPLHYQRKPTIAVFVADSGIKVNIKRVVN